MLFIEELRQPADGQAAVMLISSHWAPASGRASTDHVPREGNAGKGKDSLPSLRGSSRVNTGDIYQNKTINESWVDFDHSCRKQAYYDCLYLTGC